MGVFTQALGHALYGPENCLWKNARQYGIFGAKEGCTGACLYVAYGFNGRPDKI